MVLILANAAISANDSFYYLEGDSVMLYPADNKIVIGFNEDNMGNLADVFLDYPALSDTVEPNQFDSTFFVFGVEPGTNIDDLLISMNQDSRILVAHNVYLNVEGGEVVFGNKITIRVSNSITTSYLDSLMDYYGVMQFGYDDTKPSIRYLVADSSASLPVLDIANRLYEEDEIIYSHPRFRCDFEKFYFPGDSLFNYQWNYYNPNIYIDD